MFQTLVNHNDDIKRLVNKGYSVAIDSNHLIVRDIPYLDEKLNLQTGAFVAKLVFIDTEHVQQDDHQIYFAGGVPYGLNGVPIPNLAGGQCQITLSDACSDVVVQRSFSNKPKSTGKFNNFFEKVESYVNIISGPAMEKYEISPLTFRSVIGVTDKTVFKFQDTLTSLAGITDLSLKFKDDVIAIIGAGGTGSYVLDFLAKTPVHEIRVFDLDKFFIHNAFRSPGKIEETEFGKAKVEVYKNRYDSFRHGLVFEPTLIDSSSEDALKDITFAFVCVDKGSSRSEIFNILISMNVPFIDVGMGLNRKHGPISGMLRATYFSPENGKEMRLKRPAPEADNPDDQYSSNIQIGELNALNACLAVIRFKKLRGFYFDENPNYNLLFNVPDFRIIGESEQNEI